MAEYKTKQKEMIMDFLKSNLDRHVTAAEIAAHLRNDGSPVGMATVYRLLNRLVELGRVWKYTGEDSGACFQYISDEGGCHEHYHLKCTGCGRLIHLSCEFISGLEGHVLDRHNFKLDASRTVFYGKCSDCGGGEKT